MIFITCFLGLLKITNYSMFRSAGPHLIFQPFLPTDIQDRRVPKERSAKIRRWRRRKDHLNYRKAVRIKAGLTCISP